MMATSTMAGAGYNYLVMSVDCLAHSQHMHTATEAVPSAVPCAHAVYIGHSTHQTQSCGNSLEIPFNMIHSNLITDNQILTMNVVIHKRVGRGQYELQSRTAYIHYTCTKEWIRPTPHLVTWWMTGDCLLRLYHIRMYPVCTYIYNAYLHEIQYYM